jgi:hypothetical protein
MTVAKIFTRQYNPEDSSEQMSDYHLLKKNLGIHQIHEDIVMHKLRRLDVHEN